MKRKLFALIACIVMVLSLGVTAYARDDVDSIKYVGEGQSVILSICTGANQKVGVDILNYTGDDGLLSFSNKKYKDLTVNERKDFMETALVLTKESGLPAQVKNKTYNFIAEQDTTTSAAVKYLRSDASADFARAASWFKPFGSAFGVILGVISLGVFMFMGLSILFDVAYMSLPFFRVMVEKDERKKPRLISTEAYSSVKEIESNTSSGEYKNTVGLYFKRRTGSLIVMSIALGYLISGQIYDIIAYLIDSFSWIFTASY